MSIVTLGRGLTVTVAPERGGKIVSIRDDYGVEWLAQPEPNALLGPGASFVEAEMAGWDECAPSITACTVLGRSVPDHGDLWNVPFQMRDATAFATGASLGYLFERTITPIQGGVLVTYRAETIGDEIPFLWAAHPQFSAPPGTRVELPTNVVSVVDVVDPALPVRVLDAPLASIDTVPALGSRKWYVEPPHIVTSARIVRGDGSTLSMEWSENCPYLGVWFDNCAFSREPVIAIEPSTGYFDSLQTAIDEGKVAMLHPGVPLTWWVRLRTHAPAARL